MPDIQLMPIANVIETVYVYTDGELTNENTQEQFPMLLEPN